MTQQETKINHISTKKNLISILSVVTFSFLCIYFCFFFCYCLRDLIIEDFLAKHPGEQNFSKRAGYDPYDSSKDPPLREIGKKGGDYVKQNIHSYQYPTWNNLQKYLIYYN